ncbi:23892_t:CDS:1, partial [Cetraspora pellucida]
KPMKKTHIEEKPRRKTMLKKNYIEEKPSLKVSIMFVTTLGTEDCLL